MADYRLKDPARGLLGPVRLETVRDLVAAGVVADEVTVSKDGGPWLPVRSFRELYGEPLPGPISDSPTYSGDLGKNTFFKVFHRFHVHRANGLLELTQGARQRRIFLELGQPVFVSSNIEGERIGEFLLERGKVDPNELKVAIDALPKYKNQLGKVLVQLGLIEEREFYAELRELQIMRLIDLCAWETGRYAFYEGRRHDGEKLDLELSTTSLILRAARGTSDAVLQRRLQPHWRQIARRQPHPELDRGAIVLTQVETRALQSIDNRRTVAEIVDAAGTARERRQAAMMIVYLLAEIDALTFS
jgi:hypothetical protein